MTYSLRHIHRDPLKPSEKIVRLVDVLFEILHHRGIPSPKAAVGRRAVKGAHGDLDGVAFGVDRDRVLLARAREIIIIIPFRGDFPRRRINIITSLFGSFSPRVLDEGC